MKSIELITTGGTIEKTYDDATGQLTNRGSIVQTMLRGLNLPETKITIREIINKDSLEFTDDDRALILKSVRAASDLSDGIVLLHGTDTLSDTGEYLLREMPDLGVPVVITGAMRPYEMKRSDALQNLTEALLAATILEPGVYFVGHGKALKFPGVIKDRANFTFMKPE